MINKKRSTELKVCQQFVRCFNSKYERLYSEPELVPENEEVPDCFAKDIKNQNITYQFEITKSSPQDAENMGKDSEHEFLSESQSEFSGYLKQASILFSIVKDGKSTKYSNAFKSSLILLLQGADVDYYNRYVETIASKVFSDSQWQEKFRKLGLKEIWYVSTKDIFQFYPI